MTNQAIQDVIDSLDDLLDDERAALLAGDLEKIARLHDRKAGLIERLRVLDLQDAKQIQQISDKIGRNQQLLGAAIDGIRAVASRIAAVRQVRENLDTYDETGQKKSIATSANKALEKRA